MDSVRKYIKKRFSFIVDTPNISYTKKFELDKNVKLVKGLLMSTDMPQLMFYRGSQKIELSGVELFPEGWESKLLMSGISIAPDDKFADLGDEVLAGNGEFKVWYKDTDNATVGFAPYEVSFYLICELN